MRILFVTPYYIPELQFGGPPKKIHSIACGLVARGHQVRVVTFDHRNRAASDEREVEGVRIQYLPWRGRGLRQVPAEFKSLRRAVTQNELTHCYGLYNFLCPLAAAVSSKARIPFVLEPLGMFPPRARNQLAKHLYNFAITKWLVRKSAAIVAASLTEARELGVIARAEKIVIRRNGIDLKEFRSLPSGEHLRERWGIAPSEQIVLFVGRISPIKNLGDLIVAFGRADVSQVKLILVGPQSETDYETKLRAVIQECGLQARVILVGPLYGEEQRAALKVADLFVLPSLSESFGNAAAEAVAAGVPVLVTNTCGIASIVHERAGLAVALGVDNLATGLRVMLDPAAREPLLAKREEVRRELSWEEPIIQTERLYQEIVGQSNGRRVESIPDRVKEKR
jgi:glycosyltransferase involved in cell wall biosynthesis